MLEAEDLNNPFSLAVLRARLERIGEDAVFCLMMYPNQEALTSSDLVDILVGQIANGGEIPSFLNERYALVNEGNRTFLRRYFVDGFEDVVTERVADASVCNIVLGVSYYTGIDLDRIQQAAKNHNQLFF